MRYAIALLCVFAVNGFSQQSTQEYVPQDHRPPLFFREDFKAPPEGIQEMPISQRFIASPNLELKTYGPGKELIQIDHHQGEPKDDPNFVWTGLTPASWALLLRDRGNYVDLTGLGKIRWRTEQVGFHELHPVLKLADGTFLVGEYAEGWTPDWHESEFWPAYIRWRLFNPDTALEMRNGGRFDNGKWVDNPDLSKVDEIGFTDLMAGSGHGQGGWSRIDWIEVYGNPVKRPANEKTTAVRPAQ